MAKLKLAVVVGSNRRDSTNRKLAQALTQLGAAAFEARFVKIDDLPMYNQDDENPVPADVARFKGEIEAADAVLFVTPEHNRSIPALLKNAIDWGSRPWGKSSWPGKPAAVIGASGGGVSTAIAQSHLRAVLSSISSMHVLGGEHYIQFKPELIDAEGKVTDESVRDVPEDVHRQFRRHSRAVSNAAPPRPLKTKGNTPMSIRPVKSVVQSKPTMEGAGVKLAPRLRLRRHRRDRSVPAARRFPQRPPEDYLAGFPWHPHRGIETITYVLDGTVDHGDSLGNRGSLGAGDVQWMTAGSGIMHQEMPQGDAQGRMHGFQLWANLPSSLKMTAPRYQDVESAAIPDVVDDDGTRVRVVCGEFWGKRGPVDGVAADPRYLDVFVPAGQRKTLKVEVERHAFAYVFEGDGRFAYASKPFGVLTEKQIDGEEILFREPVGDRSLVLFDSRRRSHRAGRRQGIRFLLVSGKPIKEPVAWYGPIVMNTQQSCSRPSANCAPAPSSAADGKRSCIP